MNYVVREGKAQVFEDAFAKVLNAMASIEGHKETKLFRDVAESSRYLILSEWSDEQTFHQFVRSDQFAAVTNWGKEEVLAERPVHNVYES
jgi:heme-degrading monooxygenase HmoA